MMTQPRVLFIGRDIYTLCKKKKLIMNRFFFYILQRKERKKKTSFKFHYFTDAPFYTVFSTIVVQIIKFDKKYHL